MDVERDFEAFVAARYVRLVRVALLLGCRPADAEDAVQDALAACYRSWGKVAAADTPDAYAHRVLVNKIVRGRRRSWRGEIPHQDLPERAATSDHAAAMAEAVPVRAALTRLTAQHRAVLVLRYFADLSEAQTAAALGIPIGTVKSRASRGLAQLQNDPALAGLADATGRER